MLVELYLLDAILAPKGNVSSRRLLFRSEVASSRPNLKVLLQRGDLDGPVVPIGIEIRGVVRDHILAAQFVFNSGKGVLDVLHLVREEGAPACRIGQLLKNFVAPQNQTAVV